MFRRSKKRASVAAPLAFLLARAKKLGKQQACQPPVFRVDAILHFGGFNLALYQPCIFQFLEMLRNRGFRYGQFFVDIAKIAHRLPRKKLQDSHAGRMSDGLGEARQLFLIGRISLSSISVEAGKANCSFFAFILFAKSRTTGHCANFSIRKSAFRRQLPRIHYKNKKILPRIHYKVAIFAEDRLRLGIRLKQVWSSALALHYLCRR